MVDKLVDAAADPPRISLAVLNVFSLFTRKVGQMPEISLEALGACQTHQAVNALIVKTAKIFLVVVFAARVVKDPGLMSSRICPFSKLRYTISSCILLS